MSMFWHLWNICANLLSPLIVNCTANLKRKPESACAGATKNDWPVLATALGLGCDIWTEDPDFFGTGIAVWTTNRIEIFLKSQMNRTDAEQ
jgi:predicted nucleic acid-binding protein